MGQDGGGWDYDDSIYLSSCYIPYVVLGRDTSHEAHVLE